MQGLILATNSLLNKIFANCAKILAVHGRVPRTGSSLGLAGESDAPPKVLLNKVACSILPYESDRNGNTFCERERCVFQRGAGKMPLRDWSGRSG